MNANIRIAVMLTGATAAALAAAHIILMLVLVVMTVSGMIALKSKEA